MKLNTQKRAHRLKDQKIKGEEKMPICIQISHVYPMHSQPITSHIAYNYRHVFSE